ncbi:hypothetical protein EGW08_000526 [Elysia chlorotica]|uniref:CX domain-containing protein n=1 Tax=Elysia chlorotica TaxID=188477 RepID=A0A433UCS5_ELYCH|nr:hypothetical protein EGW08_000526 [Elysia chlorotica]
MAAGAALFFANIFAFFIGVEGWRCAKYQHYFSQQPDYIECVWDCCGNSFNRHCCAPIGIIVGCSIVGAVVLAALIVVLACWWQKRRSRYNKGPRLFHNRKHSHYPVAPSSVTRPAPLMPGGPEREGQIYRPPPSAYRPRPSAPGFDPEKKVPPTDFYGPDEEFRPGPPPNEGYRQGPPPNEGYRQGPPPNQGFRQGPPPNQGYRQGPPPNQGYRQGPPSYSGPPPQQRPPVTEYFD